jgi:hypothetical protein
MWTQRKPASREPMLVEELERRILHSADIAPLALYDPAPQSEALLVETAVDPAGFQESQVATRELVFVDPATPDYQKLVDSLKASRGSELDIVLLDAGRDGIDQITEALATRSGLSAVHIISHGSAGSVELGTSKLDAESLSAHAHAVAGWSGALSADADLLIYGCDVAASAEGEAFLSRLARITGADVAASTNPTGSRALGGDWNLEYATSAIEAPLALGGQAQAEWLGLLAPVGAPGELQVPTTTSGNQTQASAAMDANGNFVVVWTADGNLDGNGEGIFAQRFDASGNKLGGEVRVNTTTTNDQAQPAVAMDPSGNYVVVWWAEHQDADATDGIYGQRYNAGGMAQGAEFRVNSSIPGHQSNPAVAMDANGNFTVVWTSNQNGNLDVFARQYNAAGTALGAEMQVNTTAAGAQSEAHLAMDSSGNFVVVWTADGNLDGDGKGVFAQRFDSSGAKLGGEVRVATQTSKDQMQPAVAMAPGGSYVVAWTSESQDGDHNGIFAQRFNAAGVAQGAEFLVNTTTHDHQDSPAVAIDSAGRFTVVWQSNNQDGSNKGIYAQSYDAAGFTIGSEFRVNATTANAQSLPAIAMRANGDFAVAWQGQSATDNSGVAARRYSSTNQAPVNVVPGAQVAGGSAHVFSTGIGNALQVTDIDAGGAVERVTLTATNGTLTLSQTTGLSFTAGDGTADATMTFDGTLAALNAALDGMSFTATQNFSGAASVQIVANDLGFNGAGGALTDTDTVAITVTTDGTPFILSGSYTGNAVDNRVIAGLGFTPDVVIVKVRDDNKVAVIRTSNIAGDAAKPLAGGTALAADEIQSLDANGFTVGTDDTVNKLGKTYDWIAFKASAGFLKLGTYAGDGTSGRAITGVGFSPDALFVFDAGNQEAVFTNAAAGGTTFDFGGSANAAWIPSLDADGFTLGSDNRVNGSGRTYYYVVWNEQSGLLDVGSYAGDGADSRNIGGLGFQPEWVVVKNTAGDSVVQHFDSQGAASDSSSFFTGDAATTNRIQQLQADGFQVGDDNDVNDIGRTYTYMAFRQETPPTISDVANQATTEGSPTAAIAFTVGDAETAAGSLSVVASSSNQSLVADANIVIGGSGANRTVTITPAADQSGTVTITLRASDGLASASDTFVLTVNPINDPPAVSAPTDIGVNEDEANGLVGISFSDSDAGGSNVQATFTVLQGTLAASSGGGVTVGGTALSRTLTGSLANLNAFIDAGNLTYTTAGNDVSPVTLEVSINDLGNTGAGGPKVSATSNVTLNVTPVNDAPVNTVPGAQSTNEDTSLVFSSANGNQVSVADVDAGTLEVTLTATQGTISLAGTAGLTFSAGDGTADATMTFSGSAASINTAMNGMSFAPSAQYSGAAALAIATSDLGNTGQGDVLTDSDSIAITVNAVNDAPVNSVPGAQSTPANTAIVFSTGNGNAISVSDVDAGASQVELTLSVSNGTLTLGGLAGLTFTAGDGTADATMTFRGTLTDLNAALQGLRYDPTPAFSGSDALNLTSNDLGNTGSGGAKSASNSVVLNVAFANSAPVLNGANDLAGISEDQATNPGTLVSALIAGQVTDIDAGALTGIAVTAVNNTNGAWQYSTDGGSSWSAFGTPTAAASRLLAADGNTYVRFVPNANFSGTVAGGLTFRAWDRTSGTAGGTADTGNFISTVGDNFAAVSYSNNDGSVSWSAGWVDSDGNVSGGDIRVSGGELVLTPPGLLSSGDTIYRQADLSGATAATLSFAYNNSTGGGGSVSLQVSGNGGGSYTTIDTFSAGSNSGAGTYSADISGFIAANTRIRFVVNGALLAGGSLHVDNLQISCSTPLSGGASAFSSATASSSVTVAAVNDAPVLAGANPLSGVNEDPAVNGGTLVSALIAGQISDVDSGAVTGIAVNALNNSNGSWEYSTNAGGSWTAFGSPSVAAARLLAADANSYVRFVPNADFNGTVSGGLTFLAWDGTSGVAGGTADTSVNGGSTAFSSASASSSITVNSVNDAPAGASTDVTVLEEGSYTFGAGDFGFSDASDTPENSLLAVRIGALPAAGTLANNGVAVTAGQSISAADIAAGLLRFTPAANANGTGYASFTFQVQDDGGTANGGVDLDPTARTLTLDVTAVNDAPSGTNNTVTTVEDAPFVFSAGDFGFSDGDGNALAAVRIASLPGAGTLALNGVAVSAGQLISAADLASGLLTLTPAPNANGSPYATFTFQVQDDGGTANGGIDLDPVARTLTVNVSSANDAPSGSDATVSILEDAAHVFSVGDFGFVDSDGNGFAGVRIASLPGAGILSYNGSAVSVGQIIAAPDIAAGRLLYTPAADGNGSGYASFTFQVQDDGGTANGGVDLDPAARTLTLDVTAVNDAPSGSSTTVVTAEDTDHIFAAIEFGFSDIDTNTLAGVWIATLPSAGVLSLNGAAVAVNQVVSSADIAAGLLRFAPASDANGASYASFTFQVQDDGGTANGGMDLDSIARTMTVDVTPVNDAPAHVVPAAQSTSFNTSLEFSAAQGNAILVSDLDAGGSPVRITLAASNGQLTLATTSGLTLLTGTGTADATMVFTGSISDVNAALDGMVFTPAMDYNGPATVSFTTEDLGNTGAGGNLSALSTIAVTVGAPGYIQTTTEPETVPPLSQTPPPPLPSDTEAGGSAHEPSASSSSLETTPGTSAENEAAEASDAALDAEFLPALAVPSNSAPDSVTRQANAVAARKDSDVRTILLAGELGLEPELASAQLQPTVLTDPSGGLISTDLSEELDRLRDSIEEQGRSDELVIASTAAASIGLSVGYVLWLLRGGIVASSLLSSLPAWRMVDPLPVLGRLGDDEEEDDESLQSLVARSARDKPPGSEPV